MAEGYTPGGSGGGGGATGPAGPAGPAGQGVPTGGTLDQVLGKTGPADFATSWRTVSGGGGGAPTGAAGGSLSGTYPDPGIAANAVGPTQLASNAVITVKIADANVTTAKILDANVTNAKLVAGANGTVKGVASGVVTDLTPTQQTALLDPFTTALKGLAPASGGGAVNFLRADGSWAVPANAGGPPTGPAGGDLTGTYPNPVLGLDSVGSLEIVDGSIGVSELSNDAVTNAKLANMAASTIKGAVVLGDPVDLSPAQAATIIASGSGGGTSNFLRADGTWAAPTSGAVSSVDGEVGVVDLTDNYEQLLATQTLNVTGDSPVTVVVGRRYTANLSGGSIVYNLPATPANNTRVAFSVSAVAASNTATVNCGGSDRFQTPASGSTSKVLNRVGQVLLAQYHTNSAIWLVEEDVALNVVSGYGTTPNPAVQGDVGIDVQVDIQTYNSAGTYTWNRPSWATNNSTVRVWVMGAGGGGGSGRLGAVGSIRGGGGGGASSNLANQMFLASDVAASLTVTVGAGGNGGAGVATADTNGNVGSPGGESSFGRYLVASGGLGGAGGTGTDGGVGGAASTVKGMYKGVNGGTGGGIAVATPGQTSDLTGSGLASSGGGGGGGFNAANTNVGPAAAGNAAAYTDQNTTNGPPNVGGPSAGPGVGGGTGGTVQFNMGIGGGGGFRGNNANGSGGGSGGVGAGGGGGGGTTNTWVSGPGGQGGVGSVRVIVTP